MKSGELLRLKRPQKVLVNSQQFYITIGVELQSWVDLKINSFGLEIKVKKTAIVFPEELISELSVKQTMSEHFGETLFTHYFSDQKTTRKWLLQPN